MHLHGEVQVHGLVGAAKCTGIEVEGGKFKVRCVLSASIHSNIK